MKEIRAEPVTLIATFVTTCLLLNIVGNYVSLAETRILLRGAKRWPKLFAIWVLVDFLLTGALFVLVVILGMAISMAAGQLMGSELDISALVGTPSIATAVGVSIIFIVSEGFISLGNDIASLIGLQRLEPRSGDNFGAVVFYASLATACLTSIWLWLALIFTPLVRLVVWSRTTGLTAIGRILVPSESRRSHSATSRRC